MLWDILNLLSKKKISIKLFHRDFKKQNKAIERNEEENRTHYEKLRLEEEKLRFYPRLYSRIKHFPIEKLTSMFRVKPELIEKIIEAYEIEQELY